MANYPGNGGIVLAIACLGVPFIAGAKLLDSVREASPQSGSAQKILIPRRRADRPSISRNRPRASRLGYGSESPRTRHTD
jgi:hypothetical protein